ncbi:unnamed protein product [Gadus morhua 'NCC']
MLSRVEPTPFQLQFPSHATGGAVPREWSFIQQRFVNRHLSLSVHTHNALRWASPVSGTGLKPGLPTLPSLTQGHLVKTQGGSTRPPQSTTEHHSDPHRRPLWVPPSSPYVTPAPRFSPSEPGQPLNGLLNMYNLSPPSPPSP